MDSTFPLGTVWITFLDTGVHGHFRMGGELARYFATCGNKNFWENTFYAG
ncbi:MAG: hypothetical protein AB3N10_17510 [Allomuricauda sp.]